MQECYVTILPLSFTLHLRSDALMQRCPRRGSLLYRIMGPLARCCTMNYLGVMRVTAPLMGLLILFTLALASAAVPFVLRLHQYGNLYCNYRDEFLNVPLQSPRRLLFPHFLVVPVSPLSHRDLSAHQGQTNRQRASGHLLSTLLPLCRPFQWGAGRVPHDATRLWNRRHRPIGPHR